ncbi:MAG TPA: HD domain-containing phosphohydrolase [Thermoguttaceae bacterium]|nr:HD domain-containing phosphohydrolase [Thermoguttaceae bacterium]
MSARILFVDDDQMLLETYQRQLRKFYRVEMALGAEEGLAAVAERGPFAVIVSDMRMPGMNGIQFLAKVREIAPDTVRMMLSGYADVESAIEAVNEGNIFRFLTKPCPRPTLIKAIDAGLGQYRLVTAERELLSKTLSGSVKVLTDVLAIVNPAAFGRTARVRRLVRELVEELEVDEAWQCELAALLCQIGCMAVSEETLSKAYNGQKLSELERQTLENHPQVARKLIATIPRLDKVAEIVGYQGKHFDGSGVPEDSTTGEMIPLGARILKLAVDFDTLISSGLNEEQAIREIQGREGWYDPQIVEALKRVRKTKTQYVLAEVEVQDLPDHAIVAEEIRSRAGTILNAKGLEVTPSLRQRLNAYAKSVGIQGPIKILVPADKTDEDSPRLKESSYT